MGEDVQPPALPPEEPPTLPETTAAQPQPAPESAANEPEPRGYHYPGEVEQPLPSSLEAPKTANQLVGEMQSAEDPMSLMAIVSEAEKRGDMTKSSVLQNAHENAVRLRDEQAAIMYGNRLAAETMAEAVRTMHAAAEGMNQSANMHTAAASQMRESADVMHRASFR